MTQKQKQAIKDKLHQEHFGATATLAINSAGNEQYFDVTNGNTTILIRIIICQITDDFDNSIASSKKELLAYAKEKGYKTVATYAVKFAGSDIVADKFHTL